MTLTALLTLGEGPSKKYRVKGKILKNDIFLYTPVLDGDWYRAYSKKW